MTDDEIARREVELLRELIERVEKLLPPIPKQRGIWQVLEPRHWHNWPADESEGSWGAAYRHWREKRDE